MASGDARRGRAGAEDRETRPFFYIEDGRLVARFRDVHEEAWGELSFERTLRVPDDGRVSPLPAGLGSFPLRHLEDFEAHLPPGWVDRGGVIMPLYRGEAMWIGLGERYPCAIKIGAGKINAVSGKPWSERLD